MISILKLLGKGLLYVLLLPLGIVFFACYGVVLFLMWIVMLIRAIVKKAKGENPGIHDELESEAERILENSNIVKDTSTNNNSSVTYNINFNGQIPNRNEQIQNQGNPEVLDYSEDIKNIENKYEGGENK